MGYYIRKKPISPWDALRYQDHQEVRRFVQQHPDGATFSDIGAAMNVTRERARQICKSAIGKLRDHFGVTQDEIDESFDLLDIETREHEVDDDEQDDEDEQQTWAA